MGTTRKNKKPGLRIFFDTDYEYIYISRKTYKDKVYLYVYQNRDQLCRILIVVV